MALLKPYRGSSDNFNEFNVPLHDGYIYLLTDTGDLYADATVDETVQRIHINPKSGVIHATLSASGWSDSSQIIYDYRITSTSNGIIYLDPEATEDQVAAAQEAGLSISLQDVSALTITAESDPSIDIPVVLILIP